MIPPPTDLLEPSIDLTYWSPVTQKSITNEELGRSGRRSAEQANLAKVKTREYLNSLPNTTLIVFTDGSALGNPGPCGAAAIIHTHGLDMEPVILGKPISSNSSSYHGELAAIDLALEYCVTSTGSHHQHNTVSIQTDCQSAKATILGGRPNGFHTLVSNIHSHILKLEQNRVQVELIWVAGHVNIASNEMSDKAAKDAALEASTWCKEEDNSVKTVQEVKTHIRQGIMADWQRSWNIQLEGRFTHSLFPSVNTKPMRTNFYMATDIKINRLQSGHTLLPSHAHKLGFTPTDLCSCGRDKGTIPHVILHCPIYNKPRETLITELETIFRKANTPFHLRTIDIPTILGPNDALPPDVRLSIRKATGRFISASQAKI